MKIYRPIKELVLGLCLACFVSPGMKAQTDHQDSSQVTPADTAKQKEVNALKGATQTDQAPTPAPATPRCTGRARPRQPRRQHRLHRHAFHYGPLAGKPPLVFDAGPLGKLSVNGIISGFGMVQGDHVPGDGRADADLSNGQIWIQKTDGKFQFYVQAGAYNIQAIGITFLQCQPRRLPICMGRFRRPIEIDTRRRPPPSRSANFQR